MQHLEGLAPIADRYDGFILDLWGVIHDGVKLYPHSKATLQALRERGKRIVMLSNAPRRAAMVEKALTALGIPRDLYDGVMTSGESVWQALRDRDDPWFAGLGRRAFWLGPPRDLPLLEGLDIELALSPGDADFVLNIGADEAVSESDLAPHLPALEDCLRAGLPMVCANPDLIIVRDGKQILCAGILAEAYGKMGGDFRWRGKPDAQVYGPTLAMLDCAKDRVLAVGDALRTDIAGASSVGIESAWVLDGIHDLAGKHPDAEQEAAAAGLAPVATLPSFRW
ncbi:MAG TPA: TIGR01459 family HAD-type hydrolase [Acidisoma sp.]|uniref:TIGR01459 family HAD-type hydrolase n=1 Tax=Acidisoma sp. TaxID=1872115 RepID=UPI002D11FA05|nr:TIGR01459 family HAD-type hydrolase [Acidisoma sp.]HTI00641.1 TIGR01459 family HAD-type hydrolase [Acidisoma sp.]